MNWNLISVELIHQVIALVFAIIIFFIINKIQGKANLVWWRSYFLWQKLGPKEITVFTDIISIQNTGRKVAKNIQLIFKKRPDHFQLSPNRTFKESEDASVYSVEIGNLGSKETVKFWIFAYKELQDLEQIRWEDGKAKKEERTELPIYPKWTYIIFTILSFLGLITFLYIIIKLYIILMNY